MTHDIAKKFWANHFKLARGNGTHIAVINPTFPFTSQLYAGEFDKISDAEYQTILQDTRELSSFWEENPTEPAKNIMLTALSKTNISDTDIDNIAEILADASTRSNYVTTTSSESDMDIPDLAQNPSADDGFENLTPRKIYDYLSQHIYGQEEAKRAVSMLVYHHMRGNTRNIVMAGPTGCGKTEMWRALSKKLDCIRIINGPQLSCDGWSGSLKISDIFVHEPQEIADHMILVIDEADKMVEPAIASGGTNVAKMIQNELLKLMDGDTLTFTVEKNRNTKITVDCSGISVVLCGSFEHMLQSKSEDSGSIGFGQSEKTDSQIAECTEEDLVRYANIRREIAGRISRIVTLDTLYADDFEAILRSLASPILKIEKSHHVSLSVNKKTRKKLAAEAERSKMGCRYIRSQLQNMLDEQMFDNPDAEKYELCCR